MYTKSTETVYYYSRNSRVVRGRVGRKAEGWIVRLDMLRRDRDSDDEVGRQYTLLSKVGKSDKRS